MKKLLKVLFVVMLCFGVVGCGSNDDSNDNDNNADNKVEEAKETALEKTEKHFALEVSTENSGAVYVYATIGEDEARFIYYAKLDGDDKTMADALGIKEGTLAYENYTYAYHIDTELQTYAHEDVSNADIKSEINNLLTERDLTIEELKEALQEKYENQ